MTWEQILTGDCRDILPTLEPESVQTCITSLPYWGLRDYGTAQWEGGDAGCDHKPSKEWLDHNFNGPSSCINGKGSQPSNGLNRWYNQDGSCKCGARRIDSQLGLESTPEEYLANMVVVFREVKRVLKPDGTLWVNMGDSYAQAGGCMRSDEETKEKAIARQNGKGSTGQHGGWEGRAFRAANTATGGLKPKDLCMMPARLAMALQADGWYLRSEIVWHKPNPMPESVTDRPTKAHEMIYLLAKNGGNPLIWRARDTGEWSYNPDLRETIKLNGQDEKKWKGFDYLYDADAIREKSGENSHSMGSGSSPKQNGCSDDLVKTAHHLRAFLPEFRNKRSVWTVATQAFPDAHFATYPEDLIKPCILAGSRVGDTVLDPFAGSGTTGRVALELGRRAILIELNPDYIELARERTFVTPGFL